MDASSAPLESANSAIINSTTPGSIATEATRSFDGWTKEQLEAEKASLESQLSTAASDSRSTLLEKAVSEIQRPFQRRLKELQKSIADSQVQLLADSSLSPEAKASCVAQSEHQSQTIEHLGQINDLIWQDGLRRIRWDGIARQTSIFQEIRRIDERLDSIEEDAHEEKDHVAKGEGSEADDDLGEKALARERELEKKGTD